MVYENVFTAEKKKKFQSVLQICKYDPKVSKQFWISKGKVKIPNWQEVTTLIGWSSDTRPVLYR